MVIEARLEESLTSSISHSACFPKSESILLNADAQAYPETTFMSTPIKCALIALCAILCVISCSKRNSIVGKWQSKIDLQGHKASEFTKEQMAELDELRLRCEFFKDGTMTMNMLTLTYVGKYSFVQDSLVKVEFTGMASWGGANLMTVSPSGSELTFKTSVGQTWTLERVK